jgi:hypothetical protein
LLNASEREHDLPGNGLEARRNLGERAQIR